MRFSRLTLLALAAHGALHLASCSPDRNALRPIVNGTPLTEGSSHPANTSLVGLASGVGEPVFCGGALIAPDLVVTAAHCLTGAPDPLYAYFGGPSSPTPKTIRVLERGIHPAFLQAAIRGIQIAPEYDVGWVRLESPAPSPFSPAKILPAGIPIPEGAPMEVAGYGMHSTHDESYDGVPRSTRIRFRSVHRTPHRSRAILADEVGTGSCYGDSGGPLYVRIGDEWYVAGSVSRGSHPLGNCGEWGGWYADLSTYIDWIESSSSGNGPPAFSEPHPDWGDRILEQTSLSDLCRIRDLEPFAWGLVHSILTSTGAIDCDDATAAAARVSEVIGDEWFWVSVALNIEATYSLPADAIDWALADVKGLKSIMFHAPSNFRIPFKPLLKRYPELKRLGLMGVPAVPTPEDWQALEAHGKLETLMTTSLHLSDLKTVGKIRSLRKLTLVWGGIENLSGLEALGGAGNLEELDLSGNMLTDLSALSSIPSLKRIVIQDNQPSLAGTACPVPGAVCEF